MLGQMMVEPIVQVGTIAQKGTAALAMGCHQPGLVP